MKGPAGSELGEMDGPPPSDNGQAAAVADEVMVDIVPVALQPEYVVEHVVVQDWVALLPVAVID